MAEVKSCSNEHHLTLTSEERTELLSVLEQADRSKLVEIHRTDTLDYRKYVERQESVFRSVIDKLRRC